MSDKILDSVYLEKLGIESNVSDHSSSIRSFQILEYNDLEDVKTNIMPGLIKKYDNSKIAEQINEVNENESVFFLDLIENDDNPVDIYAMLRKQHSPIQNIFMQGILETDFTFYYGKNELEHMYDVFDPIIREVSQISDMRLRIIGGLHAVLGETTPSSLEFLITNEIMINANPDFFSEIESCLRYVLLVNGITKEYNLH